MNFGRMNEIETEFLNFILDEKRRHLWEIFFK